MKQTRLRVTILTLTSLYDPIHFYYENSDTTYRKYINVDTICFRQRVALSMTNNLSIFARPDYSSKIP